MMIVFAVSLVILYCSFSSLILLSSDMISFYIYSIGLIQNCKVLSDTRVGPLTKKEYGFAVKSKSDE